MKHFISKNDLFYLSDDIEQSNGSTRSISGYNNSTISNTNMPHTYFNNKIVIYGRYTCPYCIGLLKFLKNDKQNNKKVVFVEVDTEPSKYFQKSNLLNILKTEIKGQNTFPIVFHKTEFIGDSSSAEKYFKELN